MVGDGRGCPQQGPEIKEEELPPRPQRTGEGIRRSQRQRSASRQFGIINSSSSSEGGQMGGAGSESDPVFSLGALSANDESLISDLIGVPDSTTPRTGPKLRCQFCDKTYVKPGCLDNHILTKHADLISSQGNLASPAFETEGGSGSGSHQVRDRQKRPHSSGSPGIGGDEGITDHDHSRKKKKMPPLVEAGGGQLVPPVGTEESLTSAEQSWTDVKVEDNLDFDPEDMDQPPEMDFFGTNTNTPKSEIGDEISENEEVDVEEVSSESLQTSPDGNPGEVTAGTGASEESISINSAEPVEDHAQSQGSAEDQQMLIEEKKKVIQDLHQTLAAKKKEVETLRAFPLLPENIDMTLHQAVDQNDDKAVFNLLQNNANVNGVATLDKTSPAQTPLSLIVLYGGGIVDNTTVKIIKVLIEAGGDAAAVDESGHSFLHKLLASEAYTDGVAPTPSQFHDIAECLIENHFARLFNLPDGEGGATPLQLAVQALEVREETLNLLSAQGVDFKVVDKAGKSVVTYAAEGQRSPALVATLIKLGADSSYVSSDSENLLFYAARGDDVKTLEYFLLSMNWDLKAAVNKTGNTPLHAVMKSGNKNVLESIRLLINHGADVNAKNILQETPLHWAAAFVDNSRSFAVFRLLIENNADVSAQAGISKTFLHCFVCKWDTPTPSQFHEIAAYLIARKCTNLFGMVNKNGLSALDKSIMCVGLASETVTLLHDNNVFVLKSLSGSVLKCLLDKLSHRGSLDVLSVLCKLNFNVNMKGNFQENTLLHLIALHARNNVSEMLKLLIRSGADVNAKNKVGRTALDIMLERDNLGNKDKLIDTLRNGINSESELPDHPADSVTSGNGMGIKQKSCDDQPKWKTFEITPELNKSSITSSSPATDGEGSSSALNEDFAGTAVIATTEQESKMDLEVTTKQGSAVTGNAKTMTSHQTDVENEPNEFEKIVTELEYEIMRLEDEVGVMGRKVERLETLQFRNDSARHTELHLAVWQRDEIAMKRIVARKDISVNARNNCLETPIHLAARGVGFPKCLRFIKYLIDNGANVFARNTEKRTFLHSLLLPRKDAELKADELNKSEDDDGASDDGMGEDIEKEGGELEQARAPTLTAAQFHDIATFLTTKNFGEVFNVLGSVPNFQSQLTPLQLALSSIEIDEDNVSVLHANLNATDSAGESVLAYAIRGGRSLKLVASLIKHGADPRHLNHRRKSMLHIATETRNLDILKYFVNLGLWINAKDVDGNTPLHLAVNFKNDTHCLDIINFLARNGARLDDMNNRKLVPLTLAALIEDKDVSLAVIKCLIDNGANPFCVGKRALSHSSTFFHVLVMTTSEKRLCGILKKDDADPTSSLTPSQFQDLAQYLVGKEGYAKLLFKRQTSPLMKTPLESALTFAQEETLMFLLKNGVFKKYRNPITCQLLHYAAKLGKVELLKFFLNLNFKVNQKDHLGEAPLHHAVRYEDPDIVLEMVRELVVEAGADKKVANKKGLTPLEEVTRCKVWGGEKDGVKGEIVKLLT